MDIRYNNKGIYFGDNCVGYEDIGKAIISHDDKQTQLHIFNRNTNKHIGKISLDTDKNASFIANLTKNLQSLHIDISYTEKDQYSSAPLEVYTPLNNSNTNKSENNIGGKIISFLIIGAIIVFIVFKFASCGRIENKSSNIQTAYGLELVSEPKCTYQNNCATVTGVIKAKEHIGARTYVFVRFYDKNGVLLADSNDSVADILAGDSAKFSVMAYVENVAYFKITQISY